MNYKELGFWGCASFILLTIGMIVYSSTTVADWFHLILLLMILDGVISIYKEMGGN